MPNRILREGILSSERIARLKWPEEVFYRRLMSVVDDYGCYYATPMLLRAACYPMQLDLVSDPDIEKWLTKCVEAALVRVYPAQDGKRYLELLDFKQRVRASVSKFPPMTCTCQTDGGQVAVKCPSCARLDVFGDEDVDGEVHPRASPPNPKKLGTRLPDDWTLPDDWGAWAKSARPELDITLLRDKFRDYWCGVPGSRGRKADWQATWRNFVRSERAPYVTPAKPSGLPSASNSDDMIQLAMGGAQ